MHHKKMHIVDRAGLPPFFAEPGLGFKELVVLFIQIGVIYGSNVDLDDLLPDPSTLSRNTAKEAAEKREELAEDIGAAVNAGALSSTCKRINMCSGNSLA